MEFKGTKGKWESNAFQSVYVQDLYLRICETNCTDGVSNKEERKANALLISKAPEMLEFIIMVYNTMPDRSTIKEQARQLIKEATEI
jgi:hypothetical protein